MDSGSFAYLILNIFFVIPARNFGSFITTTFTVLPPLFYIRINVQPNIIMSVPSKTAISHIGNTNAVKIPAMYARVNRPHGRQVFFFKNSSPFQYHSMKGRGILCLVKKTYLCTLGDAFETTEALEQFNMGFTNTCTLFEIVNRKEFAVFTGVGYRLCRTVTHSCNAV